jgi:hypothetical protein
MITSLLAYVEAQAREYRSLGAPSARFVAEQLERTAQVIRFTGAETPEQFEDRVFANEQAVQEQHFERGYQEGRESVLRYRNPCTN